MVAPGDALPGRTDRRCRFPTHSSTALRSSARAPTASRPSAFAMGCFWGAERMFWQLDGVYTTRRLRRRLHAEPDLRRGVFRTHRPHRSRRGGLRPGARQLRRLLKTFWEDHDPTQGMRQGNDVGTQYRSAVFATEQAQQPLIESSRRVPGAPERGGHGEITTEIVPLDSRTSTTPRRSPAVPGEEPERLLRRRRHRRQLPHRPRYLIAPAVDRPNLRSIPKPAPTLDGK